MVQVDPKNVGRELEENQEHDISSEGDESSKIVSDGDKASKTVSDGDESSETSSNGDESAEENDILLIPERETSVDLSQYSLRKELEDEDHFDGLVSILSRWDVVKIIQYYLEKEKVYNQFMNSCFGCLLKVNLENWNKNFCGQIVHYLLQRRVVSLKKKEVWFIIDGKPIRFGMKEFAMITGLNCGKIPTGRVLYDEGIF
ncbi:uncharacterized protein LOC132057987 [Lycium ferocissimum]|uniref:uncharacterized protein LOC132057987 n=1 Tax=Lycium ferocissimum TaxID=112874 RepID=UPI002814B8D3|nr:uncharacterized protein LOC132057987 [Lycium ferocissimum]